MTDSSNALSDEINLHGGSVAQGSETGKILHDTRREQLEVLCMSDPLKKFADNLLPLIFNEKLSVHDFIALIELAAQRGTKGVRDAYESKIPLKEIPMVLKEVQRREYQDSKKNKQEKVA